MLFVRRVRRDVPKTFGRILRRIIKVPPRKLDDVTARNKRRLLVLSKERRWRNYLQRLQIVLGQRDRVQHLIVIKGGERNQMPVVRLVLKQPSRQIVHMQALHYENERRVVCVIAS